MPEIQKKIKTLVQINKYPQYGIEDTILDDFCMIISQSIQVPFDRKFTRCPSLVI